MQPENESLLLKVIHFFFPIHKNEKKKFLLMTLMLFAIMYIYGTLRAMRDSIIVPELGYIYLPFIDLYFVCPASLLFSLVYTKLTNIFKREQIFNILLTIYFVFFVIFAFVLYPNIDYFHIDEAKISTFALAHPSLKFFAVLIGKWCFTLFGVMVEMWMPITLIILFWQFANHVVTSDQARRFYPSFGILSNSGHICAGQFIKMSSTGTTELEFIHYNILIICAFVILLMFVYKIVNTHINIIYQNKIDNNAKLKLPVIDSLKLIANSKYLRSILAMVVGYGIINNMLEVQWKGKLQELYSDTNQYAYFMGNFTIISGITLVMLSIISSNVVRRARWRTAAKIPAFISLFACVSFYPLNVFEQYISPIISVYIASYLQLLCMVSTISIVLMKCSKFTFFDNTREMVYIPLEPELKVKGKAVVDLLGSKFTIAGGSFLQSSIFLIYPLINLKLYSGILGMISFTMAVIWITAINRLNKEYNALLIRKINNVI